MPTIKQKREATNKEEEAVAFYISIGWTPEQALGIVGNLIHESDLNTTILGKVDDKGSRAIAQWHGDRLKKLQSMYGNNWTDFKNQLAFVDWELNNTEKKAGDKLRASTGVWQAGKIVSDDYERPKVKYNSDERRQQNVADLSMRLKGIVVTPMKEDISYTNNVAPYINQNKGIIIPTISNFDISTESPTFVPQEQEVAEVDKNVQELQQKANEKNFLEDLYAQPQEEASQEVAQENPEQPMPKTNFANVYNQVSQFIDTELMQQGGQQKYTKNELSFLSEIAIKDNNEYWNKNNQGKVVEINSNNITMDGVDQDLIGISKQTGEKKLMKPNKNYTFANTEQVIEIPQIIDKEKAFLKEIKNYGQR